MSDKNQSNVIEMNSFKKRNNKKNKKVSNMVVVIAIIAAILAVFVWNNFISDATYDNVQIKESDNITYDILQLKETNPFDLISQIEKSSLENSPVLLHFYTSWCGVCKKELPVINEIARKYQNTDLKVIIVVVDKELTKEKAISTLEDFEKVYFQGQYILDRNGLKELLEDRSISFRSRIPFTAIIGRDSKVIDQFSGFKNQEFIEKRIMKSLVKKDDN